MMYLAIVLLVSLSMSVNADRGCQTAGSHMCASSDPAMAGIPLKPCCSGYVCREDPEHPTGDMFCMESEAIPLGGDCRGMRGICKEGATCSNGVCVEKQAKRFLGLF